MRGNYKDGELDGLYEVFYENGQLSRTGNYKNGERDGLWDFFRGNGSFWFIECHKNGEEVDSSYCED